MNMTVEKVPATPKAAINILDDAIACLADKASIKGSLNDALHKAVMPEVRALRADLLDLFTKADLFTALFEAEDRQDELAPDHPLRGTTHAQVVDAMYDLRAALAKVYVAHAR